MSDYISRQAAIEVLRNRWLKTRNYEGIGEDIAEECEIYLKTLPSAQPVRHGKWMKSTERNKEWWWFCSNCQEHYFEDDLYINEKHFPKYCPNCGAKMDGEQEKQNDSD